MVLPLNVRFMEMLERCVCWKTSLMIIFRAKLASNHVMRVLHNFGHGCLLCFCLLAIYVVLLFAFL